MPDVITEENAPVVTVIIPCYNQSHFLGEAIESVLRQTYPHFEIVVVDDGSTDNTAEVAARYPAVRLIRQENQGRSAARNNGIRESLGSYVVFLDADDRLLVTALETGIKTFKAHLECNLVSGHCQYIASDGSPLQTPQQHCIEREHYQALLRFGNYIWTPAIVMHRRDVFESVSFDTSFEPAEDYDLYLRIARKFPVYCHNNVVAEYRQHDANTSCNSELMLKSVLAVHRSQRNYVQENKQYEEAYKNGIRISQDFYGDELVGKIRDYVRTGDKWKQVLRTILVLLRYHPRGFVRHAYRGSCIALSSKLKMDFAIKLLKANRRWLRQK